MLFTNKENNRGDKLSLIISGEPEVTTRVPLTLNVVIYAN